MKESPLMMNFSEIVNNQDNQERACRTAAPVVTFWASMNVIQRLAGSMGYYSGRKGSVLLGSVAVAMGGLVSNHLCNQVLYPSLACCARPNTSSWWEWLRGNAPRQEPSQRHKNPADSPISAACLSALTVAMYSALSLSWCQASLPSSIIAIGSYARGRNLPYWLSSSVPSSSDVASPSERARVQKKGSLFGCHHCGSRQLLSRDRFIADHMPPTKMAREMDQAFWRRWSGLKVRQSLWPQCQSCFQLQGSAVRVGQHKLVHSPGLRLHHLALLLAGGLQDGAEELAREWTGEWKWKWGEGGE